MFETENRRWSRTFLLPAALVILFLSLFPLVFSLGMTFTNMRLAQNQPVRFIGLDNWVRLLSDGRFLQTLGNTIEFAVFAVMVQYALGLLFAVILNQKLRGRWFFRMSSLLPLMMSPVAVSFMIGKLMLSESRGPFASLLMAADLPPMRWSTDSFSSMAVLIAVDTWQWTPFFILVLLAGLQSVDSDIQEAARVDGANAWQTFWRITFPILLPLSTIAILIRSLEAFKVVDIIRVVTGGGPGNATESVTMYAYTMGMSNGDLAYATAMAYVLLFATIIFATAFLKISQRLTRWRRVA